MHVGLALRVLQSILYGSHRQRVIVTVERRGGGPRG